jgi:NTP pyrophosphatase (non-canonical NTP hydrolase)
LDLMHRSMLLADYMRQVEPTDELPADDIRPVLLGLFGEVGSIMATAKKLHREKSAYAGYRNAVEEEFGDALWYMTALCRRLDLRLDEIFGETVGSNDYGTRSAARPRRRGVSKTISKQARASTG